MLAAAALLALTVLGGDWHTDGGALEGSAPVLGAGGSGRRAPAVALVAPEVEADRIEAAVTGLPAGGGGVNAFVIFDVERGPDGALARARFAGLFIGGRAAIGEIGPGGRPEVLAGGPCDVRPGRAYKLLVAFDGPSVSLAVDGAMVAAHAFDGRRGKGVGFFTLGRARFDDVVVESAGKLAYEDHFEPAAAAAAPAGAGMMQPGAAGGTALPAAGSVPPGDAMPAASADGGYKGGPVGPCPGLDGPLAPESWQVPLELRRLVRRWYLDLLGRTPTEAEVLEAARAGGRATVDKLLASEEFWRAWYEAELFYFLLIDQFRPTAEPLISLPARLARGEADPRAALEAIVISQFFSARNPGNDTFVTVVMEQVLGLKVQEKENVAALEAGKKMYDGVPTAFLGEKGATQADVVRISFGKRAFAERYVERLHRRITGDEIGAGDLARAADRFAKDPRALSDLVREWVLAPAYRERPARAKTDVQWIQALYVDVLGTRPEYRELRDTRNALLALADSTPIRLVLSKVVADSKKADRAADVRGDATRWIRERFLLLLGRPANHEEVAACEAVLKDLGPRDGPRAVLRAILSSQEYQRY
jgi:hypothetical protein